MNDQSREQSARLLVDQILEEARANGHRALLAIARDSETDALLSTLTDRESSQARQHLRGALLWQAQQNEKAKGKLASAQSALDELDITLARGILRKIDPAVLDESEQRLFDELLLGVEARTMELEDIEGRFNAPGTERDKSRKRFWER